MTDIALILHDIRSVYNVGSLFRTANAAGISAIYLTGYTPGPIDRFKRNRRDFEKTALGAEKTLRWEFHDEPETVLSELRESGYELIAIEQSPNAYPHDKIPCTTQAAFLFGNEVEGLPEKLLAKSDHIAEIPQYGSKESLNVSVAAGIMLFSWRERCN